MSQTQRLWGCSWLHSNWKDKRQSLFIVFVKYKTSKLYSKFFFNTFRQITSIVSKMGIVLFTMGPLTILNVENKSIEMMGWALRRWKRLEESPPVQLQVLGKKEKSSAISSNMAVNVQSTTWTILVSNLFYRSPIKSCCITMRCLILSNCRHAPRQSLFI